MDIEPMVLGYVVEFRHDGQLPQQAVQVRVSVEGRLEQVPKVAQGIGDAGQEVRLFFKVSAETVGAQYLEGAEEHKETEALHELSLVHLLVGLQGPQIGFDEFLLQAFRKAGAGLPDEGGHVVVDGAAAAALEVDEPGFGVPYHDIAGLKIPVHEGVVFFLQQVFLELLEIVLQKHLVELQAGGLEETVFEVVEVEVYHARVKGLLRIAACPVQALRPHKL